MGPYIDTADLALTPATRALLDSLDDTTFVSLGVLFGADLCVLGGTTHRICWEPLKVAWKALDQHQRDQITEASTQAMRDRDLVIPMPSGRGIEALITRAGYMPSPKLRLLLSARESPAFMIATHHEFRSPAVTYFQPRGTSAIVQEIPEGQSTAADRSPLETMFSYRLSSQAFTAVELARWALKPVSVPPYRPKPPRLISFFGRTEGRSVSYQLAIHRNGSKAHIEAPDISADFGSQQLTRFMTGVVTRWAGTHGAEVVPG